MEPRVVRADEACAIVVRGALCVGLWHGEPSGAALAAAWGLVRDVAQQLGRPIAMLSVIPNGAPIPALEEVPAIARAAAGAAPSMIALCIVIEGHGPWVERSLEMLSLLDAARGAFRPDALARRYATSVEEGAAWLAAALRRSGESAPGRAEILEAVELARARIGPR